MHKHRVVTEGLVKVEPDIGYLDIEFNFSGNAQRSLLLRLLFCPPSLDPVASETLYKLVGKSLHTLYITVVSFYDRQQEQCQPECIFSRPKDGLRLTLRELHYLYGTLVDFILKVAENENVHILYFSAENETLNAVYQRYVKKFAAKFGLTYQHEGAGYAIRTQRQP